jgi:hypothetical protein
VDHTDHRIGCGGEFLEIVIDVSPEGIDAGVAVAWRCWRFRGLGRRACGTLGRLVFFLAAALVFLSAAAVSRIVASDLDLGHCGRFYQQEGETAWIKPYKIC